MFFRYNTCLVLSVCKALVVESEPTLEEVFNMTFWAQAKRLVKPRYSRYLSHGRCDLWSQFSWKIISCFCRECRQKDRFLQRNSPQTVWTRVNWRNLQGLYHGSWNHDLTSCGWCNLPWTVPQLHLHCPENGASLLLKTLSSPRVQDFTLFGALPNIAKLCCVFFLGILRVLFILKWQQPPSTWDGQRSQVPLLFHTTFVTNCREGQVRQLPLGLWCIWKINFKKH